MAPMTSEPALVRSRRQAFVATCSPDELLGQVIQTLCPTYNIDAPHLLALRQLISSAIIAPRTPPTLKRTRPDKRIGEIVSIYDTSRRSSYGPNGPPVSANQSFYFHHNDADFDRLLPRVDRSRYEKKDGPARQPDSNGKDISDVHESTQSGTSAVSTSAAKRDVSTLSPASVQNTSTNCTVTAAKIATEATHQALEPHPSEILELASYAGTLFGMQPGIRTPRKDALVDSQASEHLAVPAITITTPRPRTTKANDEAAHTKLGPPLLAAADIAVELPDMRDVHRVPPRPHSSLPHSVDTQDTANSTQLSEVFSPPDDFVHYTPPTQEETQDDIMLPDDSLILYTRTKASDAEETTEQLPRRYPPSLPSELSTSPDSLGKRSREGSDAPDRAPTFKRSKSEESARLT